MKKIFILVFFILGLFASTGFTLKQEEREVSHKLYNEGNYKDAYEGFRRLSLNPQDTPQEAQEVSNDLNMAIACLNQLNRLEEIDEFREMVIGIHKDNWRLLYAAAQSYFNGSHYGYIIAGKFERGGHRGGGHYVNSFERDRIRALQLMTEAMQIEKDSNGGEQAGFYLEFSRILMGYRGYKEAWRLQYLSDFSQLPDYEEGYGYNYNKTTSGAAVNPNGTPVFHKLPKTYKDAQSDGERWRWMLIEAIELNPDIENQVLMDYANFLQEQFDVQTMGYLGRLQDEDKNESTTYCLDTLAENETIARLAIGIKRFSLPDEFNFIKIYQKIADNTQERHCAEEALNKLANIFENRRQFDKAVHCLNRSIKEHGSGDYKQKRIDQILGNWGEFEPIMTHPAGKEATVEYRFRNGTKVSFQAHEIHIKELLDDAKTYLKSNPRELKWDCGTVNISNIGYRLVMKEGTKYLGQKVAEWGIRLEPRKMHFDKRVTIKTPLKKAGAYLLTATMSDGNTSKIIIWIDDTVILKKNLDKGAYFFVADAVSGKPLPNVNVEFFGYRREPVKRKEVGRDWNILTNDSAEFTDENGQVILTSKDFDSSHHWMIIATTESGRLAYLGFCGIWYSNYYDHEYNQVKVFSITDRPVYRPNQPVRFKFWVNHARYDQEDRSSFANTSFYLCINNPKGEKVFGKQFTTDSYGGFDGEYCLPKDATLGVYSIYILGYGDGGTFRVEEYKKPEFEVKVETPKEPVMLGEKITVSIKAGYYFGQPVTKAKARYKVLRSDYKANWYPTGIWDWFYGPGYWWFAYNYEWYPHWQDWGSRKPHWWWQPIGSTPPEVVAEGETKISPDGTVNLEIDTGLAKELHSDTDHRYEITAEVTDESRRTIVGKGTVIVSRKPFKVYAWVDRGHYRTGDVVQANFTAQTLDNKPVIGKGRLYLYQISYRKNEPVESIVQEWSLDTDEEGKSHIQIQASESGQYRLSYKVTDVKNHTMEGGYLFCVMGEGFDSNQFRFNEIELVPEKREYSPGEKVKLIINTARKGSTVVLFIRPSNGIYLRPKIIQIKGKSAVYEIEVTTKDIPNFFVEAFTISDGKLYSDTREIIVPPQKRVLNVEVIPSQEIYKPGEKAEVKVRLTDLLGKPFIGSLVMTIYDKSLEYISGGSNVPEIKKFFWKWRRQHQPWSESSLDRSFSNLVLPGATSMQNLGVFGHLIADEFGNEGYYEDGLKKGRGMALMAEKEEVAPVSEETEPEVVQPLIRKEFADTAFWIGSLTVNEDGWAKVSLAMPENLTAWKVKVWAMGQGTKVGQAETEVVTAKNLLVRMQAPRFFIQKDEVVLSANIHNYLKSDKSVEVILELEGACLEPCTEYERFNFGSSSKPEKVLGSMFKVEYEKFNFGSRSTPEKVLGSMFKVEYEKFNFGSRCTPEKDGPWGFVIRQKIKIKAGSEERVDWRVKVATEGEAIIRMIALTDEESDGLEMRFPVYVHGMMKMVSYSGVIRHKQESASISINVPKERKVGESRLEIRYSPSLAAALIDSLPYLVEYPYGCTEQVLNRFLPTVLTQKILKDMGIKLKDIQEKRTNLNSQEIGDDRERAKDWKRWGSNPVFDEETVCDMVKQGLKQLTAMQLSDGGWGWFSGWAEHSYPHTTAVVVHGLQIAKENGVAIVPGVLEAGVQWLKNYQEKEVSKLKNAASRKEPCKNSADNMDSFIYMVLVDAGIKDKDMCEFLYRDRLSLSVYAKAMYGLALHKQQDEEKLKMILKNIEQYLVQDEENQTAHLNLQNNNYWWCWYGSEYEAHAYYLKLLSRTNPKDEKTSRLVKYLLNNRKHATYWNSTRDTSLCIEALADYLRASGEDKPDLTVEIYLNGQKEKEVKINAENLFTFDNKFVLLGDAVESGEQKIEIKKKGKGALYFNAYLSYFTLEDFIGSAGLEIKVSRKYYKLVSVDKKIKVSGDRGQVVDQKVEKFVREELPNLSTVKSGDLVEIELTIESKNDYEYIIFEDMKPAGFEPVEVRSGYTNNGLGAYMELRDERVCFFIRALARGKHSLSYHIRAEIPGRFSGLPTRASAMYAPELRGNSDEIKLNIED